MFQEANCSLRMRRLISLSSTTSTRAALKSTLDGGLAITAFSNGNRKVNQNVDPVAGRLSTPISPPMSSTNCLLMASPRPVPPNFRVVDASAWVKGWNKCDCSSLSMPMPVSCNEIFRWTSVALCASVSDLDEHVAALGKFDGVAQQVEEDLADASGITSEIARRLGWVMHQ